MINSRKIFDGLEKYIIKLTENKYSLRLTWCLMVSYCVVPHHTHNYERAAEWFYGKFL